MSGAEQGAALHGIVRGMRSRLALLLLCSLALTAPVAAESAGAPGHASVTEAEAREDLEYLYTILQAAHYDIFAHTSREAYDEAYQKAYESIGGTMSCLDVVKLFMPFVAFGNIGHARIDFPVQDYVQYVMGEGTLLPLDIRVENGRVFVAHSYSDAVRPGAELVSINNRPIATWIERLGRYLSAERPYMANAQLEAFFPRLLWLDHGSSDSYRVVVRHDARSDTTIQLAAQSALAIEQVKGTREGSLHARKAEVLSNGIAYLRPGPFYGTGEGDGLASFETFIDAAFLRFIESESSDLILDLRNNPGGDNSFSDPMIAWFADREFRFASQYVLRASAETRRVLTKLAAEDSGGVVSRMLAEMSEYPDGMRFQFEIPLVRPRGDGTFTGRVWALINRHTYSNAATVAAIIQDYGFGTIIGEETSDLPTAYGSSAQFTLPHTGIAVTYPKAYFVRPGGETSLCGVIPDKPIECPIVSEDKDSVLEEAIHLVLAERSPETKDAPATPTPSTPHLVPPRPPR